MNLFKKLALIVTLCFTVNLNAQNKTFNVEVVGKGEPVLLFPGFTCTGDVWSDVVKELAKTNTCHVFTFAGFGDVPAIEKPWLPKIKEGIDLYISQQKLENVALIGHSLGGTLALWMGTENKNIFRKIIVVDALPSTGALMMRDFNKDNIVYDNPYSKQLLEMNDEAFEKMASQFAVGMALNKEKHDQIKAWIIQTDRETYVHGYTDLLKLDLREDIANIKAPVVILGATQPYGEENAKVTYETQYKNLKNYTIKYAKESAHFIMYDQPEWFLKTVQSEL